MVQPLMPLVSIGVPTFNRPEGLRRTLACLLAQSHSHLEILVSDNCSPGDDTSRVLAEMARKDARIRFVHQSTPLSISENFRFVMRETTAEYFMWAADDDEWDPRFIERCLEAMQAGAASAMSGFVTAYRLSGHTRPAQLPDLDPSQGIAKNLSSFLLRLTPSLFYGLHRRSAIAFVLEGEFFDYYDCYFALRLLVNGGIVLVPESLYVAGMDSMEYVIKPFEPSWGSGLRFMPFYRKVRQLIAEASMSRLERVRLEMLLVFIIIRLFSMNEMRALRTRLRGLIP
jgi:glycosyltransferase involved in cell wall biosynthesis